MLKIAYHPLYAHPLPEGHRFPMAKYELIPQQLLYEGTITEENIFAPDAIDESIILRTHTTEYWHKLKFQTLNQKEIRKIGFPMSERLIKRSMHIANGTVTAALFSLEYGVAMNTAGGTHHAFADRGEGFCMLNDIAIAANELLYRKLVSRILIIDLDVHQGNGTASIFEKEPRVYTFSMHGGKNYPVKKESSDLDIELEDGTEDEVYLAKLQANLPALIDRFRPDFVFYLAGVDILDTDKLGRLKISLEGCRQRDQYVVSLFKNAGLPLTICMGGGYSEKLSIIVEAHSNTFRAVQKVFF